jgi:acid phosphatase
VYSRLISRSKVIGLSAAAMVVAAGFVSACGATGEAQGEAATQSEAAARAQTAVPRFDHILVVMEENRAYSDVIGNGDAPYINSLAGQGASFAKSHAVTHPSQPNYLAQFSGSTQGVTSDSCPHKFARENLGHQVGSFVGYSEGLPAVGDVTCSAGSYARKHSPWVDFSNIPASANQPFSAFPRDYAKLPKLSYVIPDLDNDMHDGSVTEGDSWLKKNIDGYARWAKTHNSLLIIDWDEDDDSAGNQIPTVFSGAHVKHGVYNDKITHYSLLRTIEDSFGVRPLGGAAKVPAIKNVWD